jgi:hypothetical protein
LRGNRNAYKIFVRKPQGKRLLGRPRRRSVDSNKMGWGGAWTEYLVFETEKWSAALNSDVSESFKT